MKLLQRVFSVTLLGLLFSTVLIAIGSDPERTIPRSPEAPQQINSTQPASDTSLFATVVRWIKASDFVKSQRKAYPLQIDPRPLRVNLNKTGGLSDLTLRESDYAKVDSTVLRRRQATLQRLEVPPRNALSYFKKCSGTGVPRPVKEEKAKHTKIGPPERCKFTVVAVSLPSREKTDHPNAPKGKQDFHREAKALRTVTVFELGTYFFIIRKLTVKRAPEGWAVVHTERVNYVMG